MRPGFAALKDSPVPPHRDRPERRGSGTVTRLNLSISNVGSQPNAAAVVVGPTGLAYNPGQDILYVASTADNKIFGIGDAAVRTSSAGTGFLVFEDQKHLHGPLGLTLAPNGNLITANGDAVNAGGTIWWSLLSKEFSSSPINSMAGLRARHSELPAPSLMEPFASPLLMTI